MAPLALAAVRLGAQLPRSHVPMLSVLLRAPVVLGAVRPRRPLWDEAASETFRWCFIRQ